VDAFTFDGLAHKAMVDSMSSSTRLHTVVIHPCLGPLAHTVGAPGHWPEHIQLVWVTAAQAVGIQFVAAEHSQRRTESHPSGQDVEEPAGVPFHLLLFVPNLPPSFSVSILFGFP